MKKTNMIIVKYFLVIGKHLLYPGYCILQRCASRDKKKPDLEVDLKDYGIASTSDDLVRLAVSPEGRQNAIDFPTLGWSG